MTTTLERHLLGYAGHPEWRDMSEYVVHFTKDPEGTGDGYRTMLSILSQGQLNPGGPFGVAAAHDFLGDSQKSVCMSEIPLDQLRRVVDNRSEYGIAFKQSFLIANGGARVWYINVPSPLAESWRAVVTEQAAQEDPGAHIWAMTPFVHVASEWFSQYEWEREWRIPGGMTFAPSDVAFLFVPEALHGAARTFFARAREENLGPSYACPLLDPNWSEASLHEAFAEVTS